MPKQVSERRRRSRAGSILNVNLNGGGVLLLLGAVAGALLASSFSAHRIRAHKKRRGSMTDEIQRDYCEHLAPHEVNVFVDNDGGAGDRANAGEGVVQVNSHENLDATVQISQVDCNLLEEWKGEVAERSPKTDIELVGGEHGTLVGCIDSSADIISSPANACRNLEIGSSLGENQLRYGDNESVAASVKEEGKISCITSKEDDEEGIKRPYKEEWGVREEIEEKKTSSNWYSEQSRLLEKKAFQNLEMAIAIEESKFDLSFMNEMYNSILEFVLSRDKEMEISSYFGDQDEINQLIEKIEPISGAGGEAKKALNMAQNDSGKRLEMVIMEEDEIVVKSGAFKDAVRLDILCTEQDNENGEPSNDKMVEGSRGLCEQIGALSHGVTTSSNLEMSSCKDSIVVMGKENVQLTAHSNGIACNEDEKKGVEESNSPLFDEGAEGLIVEIQGIESCIRGNPTMIMAVEEKILLEDDTAQEEKTEENMLNGFIKNVESSETKEKLRENEECPLNEFSLEQDNLMAYKESPLIQFQGIEPNDDKLNNSEKNLEREECRASNQELGSSPVQYHEIETRQYIEAHKDKLEREIEYPQILGIGEILKESQAQIKEVEEEQILKLSIGLLEKGVNILNKTIKQDAKAELIDVDKTRQCQVEAYENNVSSRGKQRRIEIKKAIKNHKLMGYPNGNIFLVTTLATAFAVLAFLYAKYFITRPSILEDFITR